jgi:hypothetical protein
MIDRFYRALEVFTDLVYLLWPVTDASLARRVR